MSETQTSVKPEQRLRQIFEAAVRFEASDLLMKSDVSVKLRIRGQLKNVDVAVFSQAEMEQAIRGFLTQDKLDQFKANGALDVAYELDEDNRFRVNVFMARGKISLAARRVSSRIRNYQELNLPPVLSKIAECKQGLVLVSGITGSGKSTTIAAMLDQVNHTRACHIITIEDPIEFIFKDAKAVINQREVGVDVAGYGDALRYLVRENPDVILIGELRDKETFMAALRAAETGHLVFGTVHASSATQTFGRIYNLFQAEERELIRDMLSYTFQAVVYQKLLTSIRPEMQYVPAMEILLQSPVSKKYVQEGREIELGDVIKNGKAEGMLDFNSCLVELVQKEYIHPRVALAAAASPEELRMRLKGISNLG